jgi:hypothetical protein
MAPEPFPKRRRLRGSRLGVTAGDAYPRSDAAEPRAAISEVEPTRLCKRDGAAGWRDVARVVHQPGARRSTRGWRAVHEAARSGSASLPGAATAQQSAPITSSYVNAGDSNAAVPSSRAARRAFRTARSLGTEAAPRSAAVAIRADTCRRAALRGCTLTSTEITDGRKRVVRYSACRMPRSPPIPLGAELGCASPHEAFLRVW